MKAVINHNNVANSVQFKAEGYSVIYSVPSKLKYIKEISGYDDGFITMQTNYGEEYTDLVELISGSLFTKSFQEKMKHILYELTLGDIILKHE